MILPSLALVGGVAAAAVGAQAVLYKALTTKVPPFTALVIERFLGGPKAVLRGNALVLPREFVHLIALTPRDLTWGTQDGGELVLADGARLALRLRLWFQVRSTAPAVLTAFAGLRDRLDADRADELNRFLCAHVATAAGEVTRGWSASQLPPSARFRNDFLERADWSFRELGLVANELEVLRLEVTST